MKIGPNDTFYDKTGVIPTVTYDLDSQSITFLWPSGFRDIQARDVVVQFLYTMVVSSVRVSDGLQVASFSLSNEVGTVTQPSVQVFSVVLNPDVAVTAAFLIGTGNSIASGYSALISPLFVPTSIRNSTWGSITAPGTAGARLPSTTINVDDTQAGMPDDTIFSVDAGDVLTLAVAVANLGSF